MLQGKRLFAEVKACRSKAAFWWLGQHSFILKLGRVVLLIDPFLTPLKERRVPPLFKPEDAAGIVDIVCCTHDHLDHLDPVAVSGMARHSDALFIAPRAHTKRMQDLGVSPSRLLTLNDGESVRVKKLVVHAIKCAHERFDKTKEGLFPYLGYVIQGEGKIVYHAGDTLWWEGLQSRLGRWVLDVAMVPINGRSACGYATGIAGNMTYQEAADLLGGVQVGLTVPTHYDMFASNGEDPRLFTEYLRVKYPSRQVWVGKPTERVIF